MNTKKYIEKRIDIVKGLIEEDSKKNIFYQGQLDCLKEFDNAPGDVMQLFCEDLLCNLSDVDYAPGGVASEIDCALYNSGYRSILVDIYLQELKE